MNKNLLAVLKAGLFSVTLFSCSSSDSDNISENSNPNGGNTGNTLSLVSTKTQASIDTPFQFYFTGGINDQINNINWDFGDNSTYYGNNSLSPIYHNYKAAGIYTVKATLLLNNGNSILKTVNVTVTNTNLLKINKITVISIPQKTNNVRWVSVGTGGMWQTFTGAWDESQSYGTNNINRFADIFVYITKNSSAPLLTDPHIVTSSDTQHLFTTGINQNQVNLVFDVSANNLIMGYDALETINFTFKDNDAANSLLEDGGIDEIIGSYSSYTSQFTNTSSNSVTFTQGSLSFKVDFQKL